jgi:hypothetical protein
VVVWAGAVVWAGVVLAGVVCAGVVWAGVVVVVDLPQEVRIMTRANRIARGMYSFFIMAPFVIFKEFSPSRTMIDESRVQPIDLW